MTVDETIKQIINTQLAEQLGADYSKFRSYIDGLNKTNKDNYNEISKLKSDVKLYSDAVKEFEQKIVKITALETFVVKLNDNQSLFGQQAISKIAELETKIENIGQYCKKLDEVNNSNLKRISALELKNRELSQKINEKETKNNLAQSMEKMPSGNELFDQTNNVINLFNNWSSSPYTSLPGEFTYVTGDFRIRTNQQEFTETREETKWIINRRGTKKYLLPNPNSFNQMTNLDLYEMDLNMLKEKGKNKIKIITPCEISTTGFIEFKGKLHILN